MLQEKVPPPSVAVAPLQVTVEIPDSASDTLPETVTPGFEKLIPSAGELTVSVGGVLLMLRVTLAVAVSPLASVTVPLINWLAPSDVTVCVLGQLTTLELPAKQLNVTVTFVLFQPLALGIGDAVAVIAGGVAASETFSVSEPETAVRCAEIVVLPAACPVASPALLKLATLGFEELQVTEFVISSVLPLEYVPVAVNCCVAPAIMPGIVGRSAIETRMGTDAVSVVEPQMEPVQALMLVEPTPRANACPVFVESLVTLATVLLEELHTTEANCCVVLSLKVPVAVKG